MIDDDLDWTLLRCFFGGHCQTPSLIYQANIVDGGNVRRMAMNEKFHQQDELCIRWFGSGFVYTLMWPTSGSSAKDFASVDGSMNSTNTQLTSNWSSFHCLSLMISVKSSHRWFSMQNYIAKKNWTNSNLIRKLFVVDFYADHECSEYSACWLASSFPKTVGDPFLRKISFWWMARRKWNDMYLMMGVKTVGEKFQFLLPTTP